MEDIKMNIIRFNKPASIFSSLWEDFYDEEKNFVPATNIKETNKHFELELRVPGFEKENFDINVDDNRLIISAKHESSSEDTKENEKYTRREFSQTMFSRVFTLPKNVDVEKIAAKYKRGILSIEIPKKEEEKPVVNKQILVE